jgi:VanZ family protein
MRRVPVARRFNAATLIVSLRDWARPLWPWFSALWLVVLVTLLLLYILPCAAPPTSIAGIELSLDKVFHVLAHGSLMAMALVIAPDRRVALVMATLAVVSGVLFECAQFYVPQRSFGFDDMTANMVGVAVGGFAGRAIRRL